MQLLDVGASCAAARYGMRILPNLITFNATISSCAKAGHWLVALDLPLVCMRPSDGSDSFPNKSPDTARFEGMAEAALRADVISYNSLINGFSIAANWQRALSSLECSFVATPISRATV